MIFRRAISSRNCAVFREAEGRRIEPGLEEVIASLSKVDARFALIGGLAPASHNVIRATRDIELLTDSEKAENIDRELVAIDRPTVRRLLVVSTAHPFDYTRWRRLRPRNARNPLWSRPPNVSKLDETASRDYCT